MKKDVVDYTTKCMYKCRTVKVEHRQLTSLLQPLLVPEWKWKVAIIDFITKFPRTTRQHDSIMILVDKLTKVAHFIPVKLSHKAIDIAEIYMK